MIEKEIERRFLIDRRHRLIQGIEPRLLITQAYVATSHGNAVRVRKTTFTPEHQTSYELTGKGNRVGFSQDEANLKLSAGEYGAWMQLCGNRIIDKGREVFPSSDGIKFDLDLFRGKLAPLAIIEVELPSEEHPFTPPEWFGKEITDTMEYANSSLATNGLPEHFIHWCAEHGIDLPATAA